MNKIQYFKGLFFVCICLLLVPESWSQTFKAGIKAGANNSKVNNQVDRYKSAVGYQAGLFGFYRLPITDNHIAVRAELLYSYEPSLTFDSPKTEYEFTYLSMPFFLSFTEPGSAYQLNLGTRMSKLLSGSKYERETDIATDIATDKIIFSASIGFDYAINDRFGLQFNYDFGMTDMKKQGEFRVLKSNSMQASLNYTLFRK